MRACRRVPSCCGVLRVLTGNAAGYSEYSQGTLRGTQSTHRGRRRYVGPFAIVWDAIETALALVIIAGECPVW